MVEHNFFGSLNEVMKFAREGDEAFGGVQIIVTGDVRRHENVFLGTR